ncbi:hypothetical protein FHS29_003842 [Saccharothrix tamanrassetensis]|uniref:HTH iclR-type domain-containing protein n=1 Tax=Saccharothrix tamanrassetensis TaxID=1051531 RepID=A0A841CIX2_9PSEU|nr:helix-turn-helix domain-containing protein [Saccharothrix tamanrassetensis]MBB5957249.1 hypothetical protein [Saccharothrix tamanrassetensis]
MPEQQPEQPGSAGGGDLSGRGVLEGAFWLLEELRRVGEAGLTRLAADAGLPKATAHRLLDQLVALGAVQRRAGRYRIGPRLYYLGAGWEPAALLRTAAREPLRELAAVAPGASLGLSVQEAGRSTLVGGLRGELDGIRPWRAGTRLPPGCAADIVSATGTPGAPPPDRYTTGEWRRLVSTAADWGVALDYDRSGPWERPASGLRSTRLPERSSPPSSSRCSTVVGCRPSRRPCTGPPP